MNIDVGDAFRSLKKIEYWRCNTTGLCWYIPEDAAGSEALYTQLQQFDWYYMKNKWEFLVALSLLNPASRLLEIGVGVGHFMDMAIQAGHTIRGVELNSNAAIRVRQKGFEVFQADLSQLKHQLSKPCDAICSFQVLEHVTNPRLFIEGMLGLVKPGGQIILSVPDATFMRRIDPENEELLNQPPHHLTHWDESVFRSLEDIFPVKVKTVCHEPLASYHVKWFATSYLRTLLPPIRRNFKRLIVNRATTLPLQWLLSVGLRKKIHGHTLLVELVREP